MKGAGRRVVCVLDGVVDVFVLVVILLLLLFGAYALWDSSQVTSHASASAYAEYKPTEQSTVSFEQLEAANPDVCAWLTLYGTGIDYPVARGDSSDFYVTHNINRSYAVSGAIFLDPLSARDFTDFATIIYGHHMDEHAMFGDLGEFADQAFFQSHPYGNLFYDGSNHGLEVFAYLPADAYDSTLYAPGAKDEQASRDYLAYLLSKAERFRDIGVTANDRILVLSTCASVETNGRSIVLCRVTGQTFEDTFATQAQTGPGLTVFGDLQRFLGRLPLWGWEALLGILFAILLLALLMRRRRRNAFGEAELDTGEEGNDDCSN